MPHVEIKCFPGRDDKVKAECAEKIAAVISETFGVNESSVSVAIKDINPNDWKGEVWDKQIIPDEEYLYKKPGYTCD